MKIIILTGGGSKRFGSNKAQAEIDGNSLLEIIYDAFAEEEVIIVGPEVNLPATFVREDPIGGGPVAAIAAALDLITSDLVAVVAVDMPFAPEVIKELSVPAGFDAVMPLDTSGRAQPLSAIYRTASLRRAIATFDDVTNQSMKTLFSKLKVAEVKVAESDRLLDIDTPEDLAQAIERRHDIS